MQYCDFRTNQFPGSFVVAFGINGFIQIVYTQSNANATFAFVVKFAFVVVLCINKPLNMTLNFAWGTRRKKVSVVGCYGNKIILKAHFKKEKRCLPIINGTETKNNGVDLLANAMDGCIETIAAVVCYGLQGWIKTVKKNNYLENSFDILVLSGAKLTRRN